MGDRLRHSRYQGCLLGGAVGDALGASIEFSSHSQIIAQYGPKGLADFAPVYGMTGAITDDTQMTLFTAEGLLRAKVRRALKGICHLPSVVNHAYLRWLVTQGETSCVPLTGSNRGYLFNIPELHKRRAPGATCLAALRDQQAYGQTATNDSKGCGGVMRVAPVGLFFSSEKTLDEEIVFETAVSCAALTHGHPTGFLTAGVFATLVAQLMRCVPLVAAAHTALSILRRRENPPRN